MPLHGISQGLQPIVSYNFGAGDLSRVRRCVRLALFAGGTYIFILCTSLMLFPRSFVSIFTTDSRLIEMTASFIPIYFLGVYIYGLQIICQQIFVSLGQAKISLFIATLRKIILLVPLIYILPNFFENKQFGVIVSEPISDIISATTAITLFMVFYKKRLH
jgi:Na+-driven multidrug efflux pump